MHLCRCFWCCYTAHNLRPYIYWNSWNFFFSNNVFKHFFYRTREQPVSLGKHSTRRMFQGRRCSHFIRLLSLSNPFPNKQLFLRVCRKSLLKTLWERRAISLFATVSSIHLNNFLPLSLIWNNRLQTLSVWKSLKFVVWEGLKAYP